MAPGELSSSSIAPGPPPAEAEALFQALNADPLAAYTRLFHAYGDTVRLELGPFVTHLLFHPEHAKHVYVTASEMYDKETYGNRRLRALTGARGLLFAEGAMWERQRRLTQPLLATRQHEPFALCTYESLLEEIRGWPRDAGVSGAVDVQELIARALFMAIARALISRKLAAEEVTELRWALCAMGSRRTSMPKARTGLDGKPEQDDFSRGHALIDDAIKRAIQQRQHGETHDDFLGHLMAAEPPFRPEELLDQVKTMLAAGHDSVASSIVFALYFVSTRPQCQDRIREEGRELSRGESSLSVTAAGMKYTEAVAMEALRLLPAIWSNERRAIEDNVVLGCLIPKGSTVVLSPYVVHRHPEFWDQPNEFQPERFLQPNPLRHRYAYYPFGGGQRICVGNNLALLQIKIALGTLLNQFQIELSPEFKYQFNPMVVLRFQHGLPLKLTPIG